MMKYIPAGDDARRWPASAILTSRVNLLRIMFRLDSHYAH